MLAKMTVKELKETASRMAVPFNSRTVKGELIRLISEQIMKDEARAYEDDEFLEVTPTYLIPGTTIELTGDTARIMIYHMNNVKRFNPGLVKGKDGRVRLTPKQYRRCAQKLRSWMKRENIYA